MLKVSVNGRRKMYKFFIGCTIVSILIYFNISVKFCIFIFAGLSLISFLMTSPEKKNVNIIIAEKREEAEKILKEFIKKKEEN